MKYSRFVEHLSISVILLVCLYFCFFNLGSYSFSKADESIYVRSVQEMRINDSWIPTLNGNHFLHKPPFVHYLFYASTHILGETVFAYRLPSAIAGFLFLITVYFLSLAITGSKGTALISLAVIFSCKLIFASHVIRETVTDGVLIFFTTLTFFCGWKLWEEMERIVFETASSNSKIKQYSLLFGICLFFSILSKSVAGLLPALIGGVFLLFRPKVLFNKKCFIPVCFYGVILPVLFSAGIGLVLFSQSSTFTATINFEIWEKLVSQGHNNSKHYFYYLRVLFFGGRDFPPYILIITIVYGIIYAFRSTRHLFLTVWIVFPIIFYSILQSRLYWYIAPIVPAIAILTALLLVDLYRFAKSSIIQKSYIVASISLIFLLSISGMIVRHQFITAKMIFQSKEVIELEHAVRKIKEEIQNNQARLIFYCLDFNSKSLRSLPFREKLYLGMLDQIAVKSCSLQEVETTIKSSVGKVYLVSTSQDYINGLTPKSECRVRKYYGHNWDGQEKIGKIRRIFILDFNKC